MIEWGTKMQNESAFVVQFKHKENVKDNVVLAKVPIDTSNFDAAGNLLPGITLRPEDFAFLFGFTEADIAGDSRLIVKATLTK